MAKEKNNNEELCNMLIEIGEYERNINQNIYKYNAYIKAAKSLTSHPTKISSGKEAKKLPGIGKSIAAKIDEYLETGTIEKFKDVRSSDENKIIVELTRVHGLGPTHARELIDSGIISIADLRKNKKRLNYQQQIGLKYLEDFEKKIPRSEIKTIEKLIKKLMRKFDQRHVVTLCGSYRRKTKESNDIDVLITHPSHCGKESHLSKIVGLLRDQGLITDEISLGDTKFTGVCQLSDDLPHRRIDILYLPYDQYYCGVLYFTGNNLFNQAMRKHASDQGYILNEYSLRKIGTTGVPGEPLEINSEEDIFDYIDFPYKKPQDRNY